MQTSPPRPVRRCVLERAEQISLRVRNPQQWQFLGGREVKGHTSDKLLAAETYSDRSHQITSHDEPTQIAEDESLCLQSRLRFDPVELKTRVCAVPSKLTAHCLYFFHDLSCGVRGHEWAQPPRRES
jgi:hypothetical protein